MNKKCSSVVIVEIAQDKNGNIVASRELVFNINMNQKHNVCRSQEIIRDRKGVIISKVDRGKIDLKNKTSKKVTRVDLLTGRLF